MRIPPEECIKCRLCEDSCPYGAIREPTIDQPAEDRTRARRRLAAMLYLLPVLVALGGGMGHLLATPLSQLHPTVWRAEYVRLDEEAGSQRKAAEEAIVDRRRADTIKYRNDVVQSFHNSGRAPQELYDEALATRSQFARAGAWLGVWVGLVCGVKLIHLSIRRRRTEYEPDPARCVSCGRCFWYCPHEQVRLGLIDAVPAEALKAPH